MSYKQITKKEFDTAYNQSQPSNWVKFAFKYFSKETEKKNMSLRNDVTFLLLSFFLLGFFGTVLKVDRALIGVITIAYSILLATLVLYLFSAVLLNNRRLKSVMKILDVTKQEYNYLVNKFYG